MAGDGAPMAFGEPREVVKRCRGITKRGERCKRRWRTADPGLARSPYYCEQHRGQLSERLREEAARYVDAFRGLAAR